MRVQALILFLHETHLDTHRRPWTGFPVTPQLPHSTSLEPGEGVAWIEGVFQIVRRGCFDAPEGSTFEDRCRGLTPLGVKLLRALVLNDVEEQREGQDDEASDSFDVRQPTVEFHDILSLVLNGRCCGSERLTLRNLSI